MPPRPADVDGAVPAQSWRQDDAADAQAGQLPLGSHPRTVLRLLQEVLTLS